MEFKKIINVAVIAHVDAYEVSREVMNKISKVDGLRYVGIGKKIIQNDDYKNRALILEDLSDPLNIGRIF